MPPPPPGCSTLSRFACFKGRPRSEIVDVAKLVTHRDELQVRADAEYDQRAPQRQPPSILQLLQLLTSHPQLLAHTTCTCCSKVIDLYGIHLQKCRLDGNLTNAIMHNNLVAYLAEMIRHYGESVRVEVSGIFINVDPSSNQRMDLVVFDPGQPNSLYDVVVTHRMFLLCYQLRQYPRCAGPGTNHGAPLS